MSDNPQSFASPEEEIEYWKNLYLKKESEFKEMESNFEEFQESSHELEHVMDEELKRSEKKVGDLSNLVAKLQTELDLTKNKARTAISESERLITKLQEEVEVLQKSQNKLTEFKRKLEQENDDLEEREREHTESIQQLNENLEKALLSKILLESQIEDLSEQKNMEDIQRLKDEVLDLKSELTVREAKLAAISKRLSLNREDLTLLDDQDLKLSASLNNFTEMGKMDGNSNLSDEPASPTPSSPTSPADNVDSTAPSLFGDMLDIMKDIEERLTAFKTECGNMFQNVKSLPIKASAAHKQQKNAVAVS